MTMQSKYTPPPADNPSDAENGYQRRRRETRKLLLEAGRELFVARAIDQVSIGSITDRALGALNC